MRLVKSSLLIAASLAMMPLFGRPVAASASDNGTVGASAAVNESIDTWMPDKGLQQDVLARLKDLKLLPVNADVNDITKVLGKQNNSVIMDITHPVDSLEGLEYFNGSIYSIGFLRFTNTAVNFPSLANLNLTKSYHELQTLYQNNDFSDLPATLDKIKVQLATRPDLAQLHLVTLGFNQQHFTDISAWYAFSQ
ncbi:hypothetical protein [Secundilactobacillus kimchicus]|uniref:hypothetical protein n=1 Tax=Secundilactobacillus kimchicus TaxID=528209 RepID=UPI0024A7BD2F|nr:hypothetical protein [Secundilactobacillus kimchicus]